MADPLQLSVADFPPPAILAALQCSSGTPFLAAVTEETLDVLGCEHLATTLLGPKELLRYRGFRFAKRQREWLAGRLAAKSALSRCLRQSPAQPVASWPAWQVGTKPDGRPQIELPPGHPTALQLSISHSHGLAVAVVASVPCGIDVQQLTATLQKVRSRFVIPAEEAMLADCQDMAGMGKVAPLGLLWTAKEAIRKAVEGKVPLGFLQMKLAEVDIVSDLTYRLGFELAGAALAKLTVHAWLSGPYAGAITLLD